MSGWRQVGVEHRWELVRSGKVVATCWLEGKYWHWSVPGSGLPRRGADTLFRRAIAQAEEAAKCSSRALT